MQRPNRLREVLYNVALEFIVVFLAASYSVILYYWIAFGAHLSSTFYVWGALVIAALIVLVSISLSPLHQIQSHRKRWYVTAGIGAVGVAFSLFLSLLFFINSGPASRRAGAACWRGVDFIDCWITALDRGPVATSPALSSVCGGVLPVRDRQGSGIEEMALMLRKLAMAYSAEVVQTGVLSF